MTRLRMIPRRLAALVAVTAMLAVPAAAKAQTVNAAEAATSSNWAGYVASGNTFSSVSGTWVVPRAKSDTEGYEATWVGLGGADESAGALEQVGTESDDVNGHATYSAWYELVPKAPVTLKLSVHPGDRMTAKVAVNGTTVVVSISNATTGKSVTKTLHMTSPDTSSAEWVAEAPSVQTGDGNYQVVPLADFGKVTFASATASTTDGHTGTISDSAWTSERVDLVSSDGGFGGGFHGGRGMGRRELTSGEATTSSLTGSGSRFSVTWNQTT
ncbi:G1 family endopeptidase [Solirubrobacter ginsenosidimutans]|uniref:G1 family endopeptidase n=1 Tax=Solirubrobacter ginsenosidimutans TaxID=490573 RepID=A0A9X3S300_9ACTN|nr:G1 family glutamic endopeptidase [Solirubrobacter ginsenosidimutans]MDA0164069.1 G1 family endopeptidase [Solirubrobacter ginsenosidimutans]